MGAPTCRFMFRCARAAQKPRYTSEPAAEMPCSEFVLLSISRKQLRRLEGQALRLCCMSGWARSVGNAYVCVGHTIGPALIGPFRDDSYSLAP